MAPRPAAGKPRKPPWYKTTAGQTIAAIGTMLLILFVLIAVNNARTESREREQVEQSFETYTEQVRALLQSITGPASEMAAATQAPPENLKQAADDWTQAFTGAQTQVAQLLAPDGASASSDLFGQSMSLFASAANTFATAADLEGQERTGVLGAASAQVASAAQVWTAAVTVLDDARDDNELSPSGLRSPTEAPASGMETPSAEATIPVETEDAPAEGDEGAGDESGGGGGGGNGGGSNQGDGSGG